MSTLSTLDIKENEKRKIRGIRRVYIPPNIPDHMYLYRRIVVKVDKVDGTGG